MYSDSAYEHQKVSSGFNTTMPWTVYTRIENHDLSALYAYLQSLEPQKKAVEKFSPNSN